VLSRLTTASLIAGALAARIALAAPPSASEPGVDLAAIEADLAYLASDALEGRDTGSRGHALAARYAADRFAAAGLEPGATDGFEQPVDFASGLRRDSELVVVAAGRRRTLRYRSDYRMAGNVAQANVDRTVALAFVGWGVSAPELGRDDYAGIDVTGRIVVLFRGAPASLPIDQRAHFSSSRTKLETAIAHGAIGVVTLASRDSEKRSPWRRGRRQVEHPTLRWRHPDGTLDGAPPELVLDASFGPSGARKLFAAAGVDYEALLDGEARGELASRALPVELAVRERSELGETKSPNVLARLAGSDPALAGETVVVTAHLDHIGIGSPVNGDKIYNGYYDNAMGSAIVLEVAREMAAAGGRPRRTVLFALVTGEEKGLLGAGYLASYPPATAGRLVADVNVDMPLLLNPLTELIAYGAEHSTLGPLAASAAARHGFVLGRDPFPEQVIFVRSDQYPFVRRGIPALFLDSGYAVEDGTNRQRVAAQEFERLHYHRPSDDAKLGVDRPTLARFTATVRDLVRAVADADQAPSWNPGDFFGERYGGTAAP